MEGLKFAALFVVGLVLIVKGADWLTDGASSIARRFNISSLVIGLTIVAAGTSAPELVVSLISAIEGKTEIAIGNVVGSNIFNALAIMGLTAIMAPVFCTKRNVYVDVPICVLAGGMLVGMTILNDARISRFEGIILLVCFIAFILYSIYLGKKGSAEEAAQGEESAPKEMAVWKAICLFLLGLACLVFGGDWLVDGASGIERRHRHGPRQRGGEQHPERLPCARHVVHNSTFVVGTDPPREHLDSVGCCRLAVVLLLLGQEKILHHAP